MDFAGSICTVRCILKLMKEERGDCSMATKKNERAKPKGGSNLEGRDPILLLKPWRLPHHPFQNYLLLGPWKCTLQRPLSALCESVFGCNHGSCFLTPIQRTFTHVAFRKKRLPQELEEVLHQWSQQLRTANQDSAKVLKKSQQKGTLFS